MSADPYLIGAYVVSLALLWGYAAALWIEARGLRKRERRTAHPTPSLRGANR